MKDFVRCQPGYCLLAVCAYSSCLLPHTAVVTEPRRGRGLHSRKDQSSEETSHSDGISEDGARQKEAAGPTDPPAQVKVPLMFNMKCVECIIIICALHVHYLLYLHLFYMHVLHFASVLSMSIFRCEWKQGGSSSPHTILVRSHCERAPPRSLPASEREHHCALTGVRADHGPSGRTTALDP